MATRREPVVEVKREDTPVPVSDPATTAVFLAGLLTNTVQEGDRVHVEYKPDPKYRHPPSEFDGVVTKVLFWGWCEKWVVEVRPDNLSLLTKLWFLEEVTRIPG